MTRKAQGSCNNNLVRILNRSESRDVIYKYCIRKFLWENFIADRL